MMDGILLLDKPKGYTSFDCVAIARRQSGERKIGHTGTLDPNAEGVLVIALGRCTRLIEYMEGFPKSYSCEARLGIETDTQDIWGSVTKEASPLAAFPELSELSSCIASFSGDIMQVPPKYSALKVDGKRLYQYAREGRQVEIKERPVTVHSIGLTDYDKKTGSFSFDVCCSKGTYVRTICADIGKKLGEGAVMTGLVRTRASGFHIGECLSMEKLKSMSKDEIEASLKPCEDALRLLPRIDLSKRASELFLNGNKSFSDGICASALKDGVYALYSPGGSFVGTASFKDGMLRPEKVFN